MTTFDIHGFVLREGVSFASTPLTADERAIVAAASERVLFQARHCFDNAQRMLLGDSTRRLVYVEGYVYADGVGPTHHGWLAIGDKVIDPTLVLTADDTEYYGVRIARRYVLATLRRRKGATGTLLDDWQEGRPILQKGVKGWRYVASA